MSISTLLALSADLLLFGLCLAALRFYGLAALSAFERVAAVPPPEFWPSVMLLKSVDELNGDLDSSNANLASFC